MEFGEERGARERAGDFIFKQDWRKRDAMDRAMDCIDSLEEELSSLQLEWLRGNMYKIPDFKNFEPVGLVLGFVALRYEDKKISPKTFKQATRSAKRFESLGIKMRPDDVLRYARRMELWIENGVFTS